VKTVGFFNIKGGVGKTTLVFHLAWMFQELGIETVVLDLDPQADLTASFLSESQLLDFASSRERDTVFGSIKPLLLREGDIREPKLEEIDLHLSILPGHLSFSLFEERLEEAWWRNYESQDEIEDAVRVLTSLHRLAREAAQARQVKIVLIDLGPGLTMINRAALAACDLVVLSLSTDILSLSSLSAFGITLRTWHSEWEDRLREVRQSGHLSVHSDMELLGYILQRTGRIERSPEAHLALMEMIASFYHKVVLNNPKDLNLTGLDPHALAVLKYYPSLAPLAQAARKPMFLLKAADGAVGSLAEAVVDCHRDFKQLALRIASASGTGFSTP
jgi:chromosome partitioning protein